jgi:hypothetical protein
MVWCIIKYQRELLPLDYFFSVASGHLYVLLACFDTAKGICKWLAVVVLLKLKQLFLFLFGHTCMFLQI